MRKLATLDGLRGVAALCIAFRHVPLTSNHAPRPPLFTESYLAVDFFCVLSGFVIAYAYQHRFADGLSLGRYLAARLVRLYPLYMLGFLLAVPLTIAPYLEGKIAFYKLMGDLIFGCLILPSPTSGVLFPTNTQAWSLLCELIVNAIFGLLVRWLSGPALLFIVGFAASALVIAVSFSWIGFGTTDGPMNAGPEWRSFGAGFVRVLYSFFAGVMVHRLWQCRSRDYRSTGLSLTLVGMLVAVLSICPPPAAAIPYDLVATLLTFPLLVYFGASCTADSAISTVFIWLGTVSYAVYILQASFYGYMLHLVPFVLGQRPSGFSVVAGLNVMLILVAAAKAAEYYLDRPIRRLLSDAVTNRSCAPAARRD